MSPTKPGGSLALSPNEFHVLLTLADGPLYGYAILKAVEAESRGAVTPEIGSLYRILARLMANGHVREAPPPADATPDGRGRPRQYYELTTDGTKVLTAELERFRGALEIARHRHLVTD